MKQFICLLFALKLCGSVYAQNTLLTNYDYWFDGNFSSKVHVNITPAATYNLASNLNTPGLNAGLHTFSIRFGDDSLKYSSVKTGYFYKLSSTTNIKGYEYWFDGNYNSKVVTNVTPASSINLVSNIDVPGFAAGLHIFNIRFFSDSANYSVVKSSYFYSVPPTANIKSYEYWFDNNYSAKVSQNITQTQTFNLSKLVDVDALQAGYHVFNIRFKDANSVWTTTKSSYFVKINPLDTARVITAYRYWFDAGDTAMVNVPVGSPVSFVNILDTFNLTSLCVGYHKLHYQFKDTAKLWSAVSTNQFRKIGSTRVDNILPNEGGNTGYVTMYIYGEGFYDGISVKLALGNDTISYSDSLLTIIEGNKIAVTFYLGNHLVGYYDVIIENPLPFDTVMVLKNGFHIVQGLNLDPSMSVLGPSSIRFGQWQEYNIKVRNNSNVDLYALPIWFAVSNNYVETELEFDLDNPIDDIDYIDSFPVFLIVDTIGNDIGNYKLYSFINYIIKANDEVIYKVRIKSANLQPFKIKSWCSTSFLPNQVSITPKIETGVNTSILDCIFDLAGWVPGWGCAASALKNIVTPTVINLYNFSNSPHSSGVSVAGALGKTALGCIPKEVFLAYKYAYGMKQAVKAEGTFLDCFNAYNQVRDYFISTAWSRDPNEKIGPSSLDTISNIISSSEGLNYVISFENDSAATAPAQTVTILDTLNTNVFDKSTFQLGSVTIGDTSITFPPGLKSYTTDIDLSALGTFYVCRINADLIDSSGVVRWNFQTLNPYTLAPETGVFDGFLPPNVHSPEGQGGVSYSVKAYDTVSLNTSIDNKAYIYFDYNPAVVTNTWHNSIDNIKPQSSVHSLPAIKHDTIFTIKWSGNDIGSGLLNYTVYFSENGNPYSILLNNTTDTSYQFHGKVGSTYYFYSIARDSALNKEDTPVFADATTSIHITKTISITKSVQNISHCYGDSSGAINITPSNGFVPYHYQWSNGATTEDASNLKAGTYTVTVTDISGNTKTATAKITQPAAIQISFALVPPTCYNASNGSITATATKGKSPYTYLWNNNNHTKKLANKAPGTYTITITDSVGCTQTKSMVLNALSVNIQFVKVPISAHNAHDGSITWNITGGTSPYSFLWSDGYTLGNRTNIYPSNYTITITDGTGCTKSTTKTWSNPPGSSKTIGNGTEDEIDFVNLYPNPVTDVVTISTSIETDLLLIRIFNSNGKQVYSIEIRDGEPLEIDTQSWSKGIYLAAIVSGNRQKVIKFSKQ